MSELEIGFKKITPSTGGLAKKMLAVMGAVERIPKNGENKFHNYRYVTEADMVDYLRPKLAEVGIMVWTNIKDMTIADRTTSKGNPERIARVALEMTFEDTETGESKTVTFCGEGADATDKGIYKAITGAEKYALMKTFLVSTGDDPEIDHGKHTHEAPVSVASRNAQVIQSQQKMIEKVMNQKPVGPQQPSRPVAGFKPMAGSADWPLKYVHFVKPPQEGKANYSIILADSMKVGGSKGAEGGEWWTLFVSAKDPESSERLTLCKQAQEGNFPIRVALEETPSKDGKKVWKNLVDVSVAVSAHEEEPPDDLPNDPEPPPDMDDAQPF